MKRKISEEMFFKIYNTMHEKYLKEKRTSSDLTLREIFELSGRLEVEAIVVFDFLSGNIEIEYDK